MKQKTMITSSKQWWHACGIELQPWKRRHFASAESCATGMGIVATGVVPWVWHNKGGRVRVTDHESVAPSRQESWGHQSGRG